MIMEIYYKYQPVTWRMGIINALPNEVVNVIQPLYMPDDTLQGIFSGKENIDKVFSDFTPLGPANKFLLIETQDFRTALFANTLFGSVELPTWYAAGNLITYAYYICNVPNTISRDQRTGAYGARILEYRTPETPFNQEPKFGIHLINDAGRWCFYRYGEKQPFENESAYKSYRKTDRFTEEMLVKYCLGLGIPVYDRNFYSDKYILIEQKLKPGEKGLTYEEAAVKLRIKQDNRQSEIIFP